MTNPQAIAALVKRLESAKEGSRELDAEIEAELRGGTPAHKCEDSARHSYGAGYVHERTSGFIHHYHVRRASLFTEFLDAALPGENIENVALHDVVEGEPLGVVWEAWHVNPQTRRRTMGAGNTEALARRIAALKAREAAG